MVALASLMQSLGYQVKNDDEEAGEEEDSDAEASEGNHSRSLESNVAGEGEGAGVGGEPPAEGATPNEDSQPQVKRARGETKVELFEHFLVGLGGDEGAAV